MAEIIGQSGANKTVKVNRPQKQEVEITTPPTTLKPADRTMKKRPPAPTPAPTPAPSPTPDPTPAPTDFMTRSDPRLDPTTKTPQTAPAPFQPISSPDMDWTYGPNQTAIEMDRVREQSGSVAGYVSKFDPARETEYLNTSRVLGVPVESVRNAGNLNNLVRARLFEQESYKNPTISKYGSTPYTALMMSDDIDQMNSFAADAAQANVTFSTEHQPAPEAWAWQNTAQSQYDQEHWVKRNYWNPIKKGTMTVLQGKFMTFANDVASYSEGIDVQQGPYQDFGSEEDMDRDLELAIAGDEAAIERVALRRAKGLEDTKAWIKEQTAEMAFGALKKGLSIKDARAELLSSPRLAAWLQYADREDTSFLTALKSGALFFMTNPGEAISVAMEAVPTSAPSLALGFGSGKVAQAAAKAASTLWKSRIVQAGQIGGSGAGSYWTEASVAIIEVLERDESIDIETMTGEDWLVWVGKKENQDKLMKAQFRKGGVIALTEMIGVAALHYAKAPKSIGSYTTPKWARATVNGVVQSVLQPGTEVAGELLGTYAAYGEMSYGEALLEGVGGGVFAFAEAGVYRTGKFAQDRKKLLEYTTNHKKYLEGQIENSGNLISTVESLIPKWNEMKITQRIPTTAKKYAQDNLGNFNRVYIDGKQLQKMKKSELDVLGIDRESASLAGKEGAFLPVEITDILERPEILDVLKNYNDDVKASYGSKTVNEANVGLKTLKRDLMSLHISDIPIDSIQIQNETLDGIKSFVKSRLLYVGAKEETAVDVSEKFAQVILLEAQDKVGGARSVAEYWEIYARNIERKVADEAGYYNQENENFKNGIKAAQSTYDDGKSEESIESLRKVIRPDVSSKELYERQQKIEDSQASDGTVGFYGQKAPQSRAPKDQTTPVKKERTVMEVERMMLGLNRNKRLNTYPMEMGIPLPDGMSPRDWRRSKKAFKQEYIRQQLESQIAKPVIENVDYSGSTVVVPEEIGHMQPEIDQHIRNSADPEEAARVVQEEVDHIVELSRNKTFDPADVEAFKETMRELGVQPTEFMDEVAAAAEAGNKSSEEAMNNFRKKVSEREQERWTREIQAFRENGTQPSNEVMDYLQRERERKAIEEIRKYQNSRGEPPPLSRDTQEWINEQGSPENLDRKIQELENELGDRIGNTIGPSPTQEQIDLFNQAMDFDTSVHETTTPESSPQLLQTDTGQPLPDLGNTFDQRLEQVKSKDWYNNYKNLEQMMDGSVATHNGQVGGRPVRYTQMSEGAYGYDGTEDPEGEYLRVTNVLVKDPWDILVIDGRDVKAADLWTSKPEVVRRFQEILHEQGYDGLKVKMKMDGKTTVGLIPTGKELELHQQKTLEVDAPILGTFKTEKGKRPTLYFSKDADVSTMMHEIYHSTLVARQQMDSRGELNPDVKKSLETGFGKSLHSLTKEDHENFARAGEVYMYEGKVPEWASGNLKTAFRNIQNQMAGVYRNRKEIHRGLDEVPEELIGLMERITVGQEAGAAALQDTRFPDAFQDSEQSQFTPAQDSKMNRLKREAGAGAVQKVVSTLARKYKKVDQKLRKKHFKPAVEQKLNQMRDERLWRAVESLMSPDGHKFLPEDVEGWPKIPEEMISPDGQDLEYIAQEFDYKSGEELLQDISDNAKLIDGTTNYGIDIEGEAKKRVREDMDKADGVYLDRKEIQELAEFAAGTRDKSPEMSRELARIITLRLKDDREGAHIKRAERIGKDAYDNARSEALERRVSELEKKIVELGLATTRAGREAAVAVDEGRLEDAEALKIEELELHQTARAYADELQELSEDEVDLNRLKDGVPEGFDESLGVAARDILRANGVLQDRQVSEAEIGAARKTVEEARAVGDSADFNDEVYARKTKEEITVRQMKDVGHAARAIMNASEQKGKRLNLDNEPDIIRLNDNLKEGTGTKAPRWVPRVVYEFFADLGNLQFLLKQFDNGKENGPAMKMIFDPLQEAEALEGRYTAELGQMNKDMKMDWWLAKRGKWLNRPGKVIDGKTYQGREKLRLAEYMLSEAGIEYILNDKRGLSESHIRQVISTIPAEYADFIQKRQDLIDSQNEKIMKFLEKMNGVQYERPPLKSIVIGGRTVSGRYTLFSQDKEMTMEPTAITKESAKEMAAGKWTRQFTRQGALAAAKELKGTQASLKLGDIHGALGNAMHDVAFREATNKVARVLSSSKIRNTIIEKSGQDMLDNLDDLVDQMRSGQLPPERGFSRFVKFLRVNFATSALGYSLRTVLVQPLGFPVAAARVGGKAMARAMANSAGSIRLAQEKSYYMRTVRQMTLTREVMERAKGRTPDENLFAYGWNKQSDAGFWMMYKMDMWVAGCTWAASYNKSIAEGLSEQEAINKADRDVRQTQGSGSLLDMNAFQKGGEFKKMTTLFMSFFATMTNLLFEALFETGRRAKRGEYLSAAMHFTQQYFWIIILPSIGHTLLSGDGPEEDEDFARWMATKLAAETFAGIPFARDAFSALHTGYSMSGPPMFKMLADAGIVVDKAWNMDFDEKFWKKLSQSFGRASGLPISQINRVLDAFDAYERTRMGTFERGLTAAGLNHFDTISYFKGN